MGIELGHKAAVGARWRLRRAQSLHLLATEESPSQDYANADSTAERAHAFASKWGCLDETET